MLDFDTMATVAHCKRAAFDVYVGRTSGGMVDVGWGNPYSVAEHGRDGAIARYRDALWAQLRVERERGDDALLRRLAELHGKRLGCWCAPQPCHGDVLVRAAAWAHAQVA